MQERLEELRRRVLTALDTLPEPTQRDLLSELGEEIKAARLTGSTSSSTQTAGRLPNLAIADRPTHSLSELVSGREKAFANISLRTGELIPFLGGGAQGGQINLYFDSGNCSADSDPAWRKLVGGGFGSIQYVHQHSGLFNPGPEEAKLLPFSSVDGQKPDCVFISIRSPGQDFVGRSRFAQLALQLGPDRTSGLVAYIRQFPECVAQIFKLFGLESHVRSELKQVALLNPL